jgi:hypothetical protein
MAYEFGRVDLHVFDFHLSLSPIVVAASLKPPMAFLSSPELYSKKFEEPPFATGDFRIRPLPRKSRLYHHFWRYYSGSFDKLDPWRLSLPFMCEHTGNKLSVLSPGPGIRAFARPATYLFPFGWSNTIEISLQGKMSPNIVKQFVGNLRKSRNGPFQLNGKDLALSSVFGEYSNQLKKACFIDGTAATDFRRLDRYIIVNISRFTGDVVPYKNWTGVGPAMSATDKAMFHSLLLGEDVPMAQVAGNSADFLLTRYHGAGFALSYFERGTLLFLQEAANAPHKTGALRCFSNNILLCLMMMRSLLGFHAWPDTQSADDSTLLGQTRDMAKQQLLAIPSRYTNPLCQTWFQYYGPWKNLKPVEKQPDK